LPFKGFPPVFGKFEPNTVLDEYALRQLLGLEPYETCADFYGHYTNCIWAVVEDKGRHLKDGVKQVRFTVEGLRKMGKPVRKAVIVADTFGTELGIYRRNGKQLWLKVGRNGQPIYADTIKKDIVIEGWQPNEWEHRW
jgi:hypothetical protein